MGQKEELDWTCCKGRCLMKLVLEGKMEGKRPRRRPRMGMINDVLDETYGDMKRKAENQERWRIWKPSDLPLGRKLMMMMIIPHFLQHFSLLPLLNTPISPLLFPV